MRVKWRVPPVFRPLLGNERFLGAKGGRGSGKSHFFAGLAVVRMLEGRNVLCIREIQRSIADSVKRLVEAKIEEFGVGAMFSVTEAEVRCARTGAVMIFRGMQNHTAASVKSLEGFDIAWWEEAQTASQRSLDLLIPTIRTPGSQLLFSWNPEDEGDPIEKLLVAAPPENARVVTANWQDNPWFPEELRGDMERDRERDPDKYAHVWEGMYRSASEARIFRNWRLGDVDVPENIVWFYGVDWGFANDPTAGVRLCFPNDKTLYVSDEAYEVGVEMERLPAFLGQIPGMREWPSAADSARPETIDYVRRHGLPRMKPARKGKGSVEDGIEFLRSFDIVVSPRCPNFAQELRRYAFKTDKQTGEILPVPEDAWNHCIAEGQRVLTERGAVPIEGVTTADRVMTRSGYRSVLWAGMTDTDREVLRVRTTLGDLVCTPDHLVFTSKGFVRADALRYDDEIIGDASWSKSANGTEGLIGVGRNLLARLTGITSSAQPHAKVTDQGFSTFTGKFGKTLMARYRRAIIFTTATATQATTRWKIWSAFQSRRMSPRILGLRADATVSQSTLIASAILRRPGTAATKAAKLIAGSAQWPAQISSLSKRPASAVVSASCQESWGTLTGSAPTSASQRGVALLGWMMSAVNAKLAAQSSWRTGISQPEPVAGRVVTVSGHGRSKRVYDLTVEGAPEFFCEGILVHNCIDAARYATERLHRRGKLLPNAIEAAKRDRGDYGRRDVYASAEDDWRTV